MNEKLLPCPFCGSDAQWTMMKDFVRCSNSSCFMIMNAINPHDWNTRTEKETSLIYDTFNVSEHYGEFVVYNTRTMEPEQKWGNKESALNHARELNDDLREQRRMKPLIRSYKNEAEMLVDIKQTISSHHELLKNSEKNFEYSNSHMDTDAVRAIVLLEGMIERAK